MYRLAITRDFIAQHYLIGGDWGSCDPANPRNRRRRCSLLISATDGGGATHVLIDTSPDLREQALAALTPAQKRELVERWELWAHAGQVAPPGDWRVWLIRAGRQLSAGSRLGMTVTAPAASATTNVTS